MTIQKGKASKFGNLKAYVISIMMSAGLFAFSCAPLATDGVGNEDSAPGPVTNLIMAANSSDSTSFTLQWSEPRKTGLKLDGTALNPNEVRYRIYYTVGTAGQFLPTAELVKQNSAGQNKEVTGVASTIITGLAPNTRYFVTVASYNSFARIETPSTEVGETTTNVAAVDFEGSLSYGESSYSFNAGSADIITPDSTPSIPSSGSGSVRYGIEKIIGADFTPPLTIDDSGIIAVAAINDEGSAVYRVTASADGYTEQTVTLTISILEATLEGSLSYGESSYSFSARSADIITPDSIPSIPSSGSGSVRYRIEKIIGADFTPPLTIDDSGIIAVAAINDEGSAVYRVTASADSYTEQTVTLTISILEATLEGSLSYGESSYSFNAGSADTITPDSTPSIPSSGSGSVRYRIEKIIGADFTPPLTIDDSGIIAVAAINDEGSAVYRVTASADGYAEQTVTLTIIILEVDFEGSLSYGESSYSFNTESADTITPDMTPSIPVSGSGSVSYGIEKIIGADFNPPLTIDDSGIITVAAISDEGTAVYRVTASADSYTEQTATLTISISEGNLEGTLIYPKESYSFLPGSSTTITPKNTPSVPDSSSISYRIEKIIGADFNPPLTVDDNGIITVAAINDEGIAVYRVIASVVGYADQTATLTISISKVDFEENLAYGKTEYRFATNGDDTITPDSIPSIPSPGSGNIRYEISRNTGTNFTPPPTIDGNGVITIASISDEGTATYDITASAIGYNEQTVSLSIIIETGLVGALSYAQSSYSFDVGFGGSITPDGTPSIPSSGGGISYRISKSTGTNFTPPPTINGSGIITINSTTNAGIATYLVEVSAIGYHTEEVTLTIAINEKLQISPYHNTAMSTDPVELGQAVKDSGTYVMANDVVILTISTTPSLADGDYTIHFGSVVSEGENDYSAGSYQKTVTGGTIQVLKSELEDNSFSFTNGAVIGMSGSAYINTQHVATYRPSNIYNHQDLQAMRQDLSRSYVLKNNIVFTSTNENNYEAVGDKSTAFTGTFDGAGKSITGVRINNTESYQGLFGVMTGSTFSTVIVKNLTLKDFTITGGAVLGALAGEVNRGTVDNVHVEVSSANAGKIKSASTIDPNNTSAVGGLIGNAGGTDNLLVRIQNTSSEIKVTGAGSKVGGLIGVLYPDNEVTRSYASGSVIGNIADTGGLVGVAYGNVSGYATGNVTGDTNVGGLVGYNSGIMTGYATGNVAGTSSVGGLLGSNSYVEITGYAKGNVTGTDNVGGLVGYNLGGDVTGYARGIVRRNSGSKLTFGKTIGKSTTSTGVTITIVAFHSAIESKVYNGATGTTVLANTNGVEGTTVIITNLTTNAVFSGFAFGTALAKWTRFTSKWPAINLGNDFKATADQPTNP